MFNSIISKNHKENELTSYFNNLEKNFFSDFEDMKDFVASFKTDIIEKKDKYVLSAEIPGFQKEEINIDVNGNYLTISAEHSKENIEEKDSYIRKERHYGSYSRTFNISNVAAGEITAEYKEGVLTLILPKIKENTEMTKKIEIK